MKDEYNLRGLDRRVWLLAGSRLIRSLGRVSSFLFLPLIFVFVYGISFLLSGIILAIGTAVMSLVQYYAGLWTDRVGRRAFLIYAPLPVIFLYLLMYFEVAYRWPAASLVLTWLGTICVNALQYPAIQASVADISRPEQRLSAFTAVRMLVNVGAALGPLLGGFLATMGFQYVFLSASVATVVEVIMLYSTMSETYTPTGGRERERIDLTVLGRDRFLLIFSLIGVLAGFVIRQDGPALTLYVFDFNRMPIIDIGYIYSMNGLLVVALQFFVLRVMTMRSNAVFWRGIGMLFYAASFALLTHFHSLGFLLAIMAIITVGEDFVSPTTQAIITNIAPQEARGTYIGVYNLLTSAGRVAGTAVGLYLLYFYRAVTWEFWLTVAVLSLLTFLAYISTSHSYTLRLSSSKSGAMGAR